ncbi:MAG: leucyl aminopeptidase family protein, partial [Pseudomonadota bacterium]
VDGAAAALEWALGGYRFAAYRAPAEPGPARLRATAADWAAAEPTASAVHLGRDLINTPASDLGPAALEAAVAAMAARFGAEMSVVTGDALLERNHPMIHAVGRAGPEAPRLIDLVWGPADAPKVTLVGKGVCFDTGGLDIKPARAMRLMKKDMGGAAAAIALAWMAMASGLKARLRLLIPAVENSVGSASFRPGDVLRSRKGLTVEIGDTDAEGRLVLADAMAAADEEAPDLLIDLATLTGAARVALGAEIAPFYTDDPALAAALETASAETRDPLWRMPLWKPYAKDLSSTVADLGNISTSGFAGSVTAALFLSRFVERAGAWAHFDIYAWNPKTRPGRPEGGEVHAARALHHLLRARYGTGA